MLKTLEGGKDAVVPQWVNLLHAELMDPGNAHGRPGQTMDIWREKQQVEDPPLHLSDHSI